MKFSGRYLQEQPAVSFTNTVQIREIRNEGDRLYIYSLPRSSDTHVFGGPMIEIYISSPLPDIIRIQAQHFAGSRAKMPQFELNESSVELITEGNGDCLTVKSGNSRLEIRKNPAKFSFYYKERLLTSVSSSFNQMLLGCVHIFALKDNATVRICDTHGDEVLRAEAVRKGNTITVSLDDLPVGAKVLLRNIDSVKSVSGAVASPDELGTLLRLSNKIVTIEL